MAKNREHVRDFDSQLPLLVDETPAMQYTLKKPKDAAGSAAPAILVGLFVAFGGVLFGYDTGIINGILASDFFKEHFATQRNNEGDLDFSSTQRSLIVSLLSAGTFFGALTAAPVGDFIGRKWGIITSAVVFALGVVMQTAATALPLFIAGRFFAGFGVGLISALIPLYQSETSPKWIRGTIVGAYQLSITIGILIASIVDNYTNDRNDTGSYRIPIAIQFLWAITLFTGMLFLPDTPRFLVKQGKPKAAAKALAQLRRLEPDHPALVSELSEITSNHEYEMSLGKASYLDCFRGNMLKCQLTGCGLQALQQLTGVNFIFYYGTTYFKQSGYNQPFHIAMITSGVNVASTLPGLYMVESLGRRNLLFFGAVGMTICQFIVAIVGTVTPVTNMAAQSTAIGFVCMYIFFFACSWGPVVWVVTGEIFPLKTRAKGLSMTTASNWLLNWAIAYCTPYLVNNDPSQPDQGINLKSQIFFIWGGCCFICIAFVYFLVYETKGLSLEQVDELYAKVDTAWKSKRFVPTGSFQDVTASAGVHDHDIGMDDLDVGEMNSESLQDQLEEYLAHEKDDS